MRCRACRAASAAAVELALFTLGACSGESAPKDAPSGQGAEMSSGSGVSAEAASLTASPPDVAAPKSPRERVVEAVEDYLLVRDALELETGGHATEKHLRQHLDKVLPTVATGYEEKRLREYALAVYRDTGTKMVGQYEHEVGDPKRMRKTGEFAVTACEDHSGLKIRKAGKTTPIEWTGTGGKRLADRLITTYTLRNEEGDWLVSIAHLSEKPC